MAVTNHEYLNQSNGSTYQEVGKQLGLQESRQELKRVFVVEQEFRGVENRLLTIHKEHIVAIVL